MQLTQLRQGHKPTMHHNYEKALRRVAKDNIRMHKKVRKMKKKERKMHQKIKKMEKKVNLLSKKMMKGDHKRRLRLPASFWKRMQLAQLRQGHKPSKPYNYKKAFVRVAKDNFRTHKKVKKMRRTIKKLHKKVRKIHREQKKIRKEIPKVMGSLFIVGDVNKDIKKVLDKEIERNNEKAFLRAAKKNFRMQNEAKKIQKKIKKMNKKMTKIGKKLKVLKRKVKKEHKN